MRNYLYSFYILSPSCMSQPNAPYVPETAVPNEDIADLWSRDPDNGRLVAIIGTSIKNGNVALRRCVWKVINNLPPQFVKERRFMTETFFGCFADTNAERGLHGREHAVPMDGYGLENLVQRQRVFNDLVLALWERQTNPLFGKNVGMNKRRDLPEDPLMLKISSAYNELLCSGRGERMQTDEWEALQCDARAIFELNGITAQSSADERFAFYKKCIEWREWEATGILDGGKPTNFAPLANYLR